MKREGKILIIDDNDSILRSLKLFLKFEFEQIDTTTNPNLLPSILRKKEYDIILLDMNFSAGINTGNEGLFWLKEILKIDNEANVIFITAYGDVNLAVKGMKEGATDFITKPWDNTKFLTTLKNAYQLKKSKKELVSLKKKQEMITKNFDQNKTNIIGKSLVMTQLFETIKKVAKTDVNVLILGENGTGKELVARELYRQSLRAKEIFLTVDMAALTESLFESELFGHKKGAFTDAKEERIGRFETASSGSLFLDEIGNLPLSLQSKILTALQNREITRIGDNKSIPIDIRLISATNKNLFQMVEDGSFREDLLYRINTIQIEIPPLRERGNDIILLAEFYLNQFSAKYGKNNLELSEKAIDKLLKYQWKGNVRELKHTIEKAVILCESNILRPEDFYFNTKNENTLDINSLNLNDVEKTTIQKALVKNKGNLSHAAKELGITRTTLYSKIKKYEL